AGIEVVRRDRDVEGPPHLALGLRLRRRVVRDERREHGRSGRERAKVFHALVSIRRAPAFFDGPMNSTMLPSGSFTKTWRRPVGPEITSDRKSTRLNSS